MVEKFSNGIVIAHHHPVHLPFLPQDRFEQEIVAGAGNTANLIKGSHDGLSACVKSSFERRQANFPQGALRNIHCVIVPAPFRKPISGVVLRAGSDAPSSWQSSALKTAHSGLRYGSTQEGVFPGTFRNPTPAWVA